MRHGSLYLSALLFLASALLWAQEICVISETKSPPAEPAPVCTPMPERIRAEILHIQQREEKPERESLPLRVLRDGKTETTDLERYLVHVVAGEMPASYEPEALKAQAVAARTYIAWKMPRFGGSGCSRGEHADICTDSTHCMAYLSREEMHARWGDRYAEYEEKIRSAVQETAGLAALYEGEPIQALFHASSGGRTEDSQAVWGQALPYLKSVESGEGEQEQVRRVRTRDVAAALNYAFPGAGITEENIQKQFVIRSRTQSGRADAVQVGAVSATGREVRAALSLSSANFQVEYDGKDTILTTLGYGHGVGMSQVGANIMAGNGKTFEEILHHYYAGVEIAPLT